MLCCISSRDLNEGHRTERLEKRTQHPSGLEPTTSILHGVRSTAVLQELPLSYSKCWAMVVAQLVERSLPTPEFWSSNPDNGKILQFYQLLNWKDKNKEKEAENGPSFKKLL